MTLYLERVYGLKNTLSLIMKKHKKETNRRKTCQHKSKRGGERKNYRENSQTICEKLYEQVIQILLWDYLFPK